MLKNTATGDAVNPQADLFDDSADRRPTRTTIELSEQCAQDKPAGGFRLISLEQIAAVWSAYRTGDLEARDVRVYLALHEIDARRSAASDRVAPNHTLEELHGLVGGAGGAKLSACVRRLEQAHLVRWSASQIRFAKSLESARLREPARARAMLEAMPSMGRVPFPRRILRHLAASGRRVEMATVLGHAIRSLRLKRGKVWPAGCTPARWIAETFGVAESRVRAERKRLVEVGWLEPADAGWIHRQRFGARFVVNLLWDEANDPEQDAPDVPKSRPLERESCPNREVHRSTQNSYCVGSRNQELSELGPDGASQDPPGPDLRRIGREDLRNTQRLLELYRKAIEAGKASDSENGQLEFVALAEYALAHGSQPPNLFAWLIARGARGRITLADEDAARDRLRDWREATAVRSAPSSAGSAAPASACSAAPSRPAEPAHDRRSAESPEHRVPRGTVAEQHGGILFWAQKRLEAKRAAQGIPQ